MKKYLLIVLSLILLAACGGGGGGSSSDNSGGGGDAGKNFSTSGTVVRESLAKSNSEVYVFADKNENGILDDGENYVIADLTGEYTLHHDTEKPLIAAKVHSNLLGTHGLYGLGDDAQEAYYLYTPKGENIISSYTTLVYKDMVDNNITIDVAKNNLAAKTGITTDAIFNKDSYTNETAVASKYISASIEKFTKTLIAKGMTPKEAQDLMNLICDALVQTLNDVVKDIIDNKKTVIPPKDDVAVDDLLIQLTKGLYTIYVDVNKSDNIVTDIRTVVLSGFKYRNGTVYFAEMHLQENTKNNRNPYPNCKVLSVDNLIYDGKRTFNRISDNKYQIKRIQNQELTFTKINIGKTDLHSLVSKDKLQAPSIDGFERLENTVNLNGIVAYELSFAFEAFDAYNFDIQTLKNTSEPFNPYNWHQRNFNSLDDYIEFLDTHHSSSWDSSVYNKYNRNGFKYITLLNTLGEGSLIWANGSKFYRQWINGTEPYNPNDKDVWMPKEGIEKVLAAYFQDIPDQ